LFLDEPPVKVLYGTDLGQVSPALLAIHPTSVSAALRPTNRRVHPIGRYR
jgi:hypothetical protein